MSLDRALRVLALLLFASSVHAQTGNVIGGGIIFPAVSSGTSVTVNLGGTSAQASHTDTGDALFAFATPLITPAGMTSPSWGSCHVWFTAPDSTNKNWGCGLYADSSSIGTVNTQNAATGGCAANCVTWVSGPTFDVTGVWPGAAIKINGLTWFVSSVQSSTVLTLTNFVSVGTQTGVSYEVHVPSTKLCTAFSSTVATTGIYNSLSLSGCGTPSSATQYWVTAVSVSNTQAFGNAVSITCPATGQTNFAVTLGSFTSNASWPSPLGATADPNDECVAAYMDLTYTSSAAYNPITIAAGSCDAVGTTCTINIPGTATGSGLVVFCMSSSSNTCSAPTDAASDTFNKIGTCPGITGGGSTYEACIYQVDRVTAGTNQIVCHYAGANKDTCWVFEVQGTAASSSADQNCYDSASFSNTPFSSGAGTSCTTGSTTQAQELLVAFAINQLGGSCCSNPSTGFLFTATAPWTLAGTGTGSGSNPNNMAMFLQTTSGTGTQNLAGSAIASGSNHISTAVVTLK